MHWIVQPSRCAAWMRQRDERDAIFHPVAPDRVIKRNPSPKPVDRETAHKQDHTRLQQRQLVVEPRFAERDLGGRRSTVAAPCWRLAWEALRNRRSIRKMVFVDSCLGEPAPQLRSGSSAERLAGRELDGTRCLPDDRDPVADGSGDDGASVFQKSGVYALGASANARVEPLKRAPAVSARDAREGCQLADYRSGCRDSNPGPPEPHSGTLPGCATPRKIELAI